MTTSTFLVAGPSQSGKTARLLTRYRRALGENRPGAVLWLAPTWRAAAELRRRLLEVALGATAGSSSSAGKAETNPGCPGCFSPGIMTFDQFAEAVLAAAPVAVRPMTRLMKRHLVRRLLDEQHAQGRLKHFGPIAQTSGLVDLICQFISELKRLEIWPEHFHDACRRRGLTGKDVELLEIYDRYQQCLRQRQLYDAEGRFWSARDLLERDQWRPIDWLHLVVADGFTDFTRTQHEILTLLGRRADELWISLPLEPEPQRADLFAKPLKTLAELRRRHGGLQVQEIPRPARAGWPAMAHLERRLFTNPRQVEPAEDTSGVEILAAARPLGELQMIGARIKRLLAEGHARPSDVAVVFRSPPDAGSLVAEVFDELGIPVAMEMGQTLDRAPALAALVGLLRLDAEDWPFDRLLAVLGGNYFQPDWPEWQDGTVAADVEREIRRLQIPHGRKRWLKAFERRLADPSRSPDGPSADDALSDSLSGSGEAAAAAAVLSRLSAALEELPQAATPGDWANAWQRLAAETGLLRAIDPSGATAGSSSSAGNTVGQANRATRLSSSVGAMGLSDHQAWQRLGQLLAEADTLAGWLGEHPPRWDRREALAALVDLLAAEQVKPGGDEAGRVRVLSAASVRAMQIPYLFVAGLSEKAFPPSDREDRLYSEAECQRLIDSGLPLVARTERNREEMLLFYEVVTRATRRLYLSYPALDDSAQPLLPSPYLAEVEQACGPGRIRRTQATDLSPVPAGDEPLSAAEFRLRALAGALAGDVSLLAGLFGREPDMAQRLRAGLEMIDLRQDRDVFGPAEGMVAGPAVCAELAARFGLDRIFSATELEQYAQCPYRFFLERVLKIEPIEELELAIDHLERGRMAHDVLAMFHRRVNQALGRPGSPLEIDAADYGRLMQESIADAFGRETGNPVRDALREIDRRLLVQWTDDYRRQHEQYDGLWSGDDVGLKPEFFEVAFGRTGRDDAPPSTERPLELSADGQTVRIAGRIDRIDTGRAAGQCVFNVIDYKTGRGLTFNSQTILAGKTLQLPLYALAAARLLLGDRDATAWQAGYWYLRDSGFKAKRALKMHHRDGDRVVPEPEWEEIRDRLGPTVASLVRGMRQGEFPVCNTDPLCTGQCPYRTICRINQVRSLEKTWQPPANQP